MEANTLQVLEFLGATKRIFNIPVYQRNYNWKQEQCKKLFDDILNIEYHQKEIHFIGTVVYVDIKTSPSFKEFIIIDGQQRITTILILLKAVYDEAEDEDFKEDLYNSYLINNSKKIEEKYRIKLKTVANDSKIFEKLISGIDIGEESKGIRILENYKYFRKRIAESDMSEEKIYQLMEKLTMVYIMLDNDKEDPQLIFESLNSTGLDLTPADLIRNYLLMGYSREKQEELYEKYWEKIEKKIPFSEITDFVKDYLTMKTNFIPSRNKIYETFKEFYEEQTKKGSSVEEILIEIKKYAKYYEWITKFNSPFPALNENFEELEKLNSSVINPFLFYLLSKFEELHIKEDELIGILNTVKCYIVRRAICNIQTNSLNKIFSNLSKEIENRESFRENFSETVLGVLLSKTATGLFPRDSQFKENFVTRDMYSFKLNKYILKKIILHKEKEKIDTGNLTLEHIMPQILSPKWKLELGSKYNEIHEKNLHLIGNITMTAYNSEISNKVFAEKKEFYLNSNIKLNREIGNNETWNEASIKERGKKIAKIASEIWNIPKIDEKFITIKKIDYETEFDINDDIDVTGKKPILLKIIGEEFQIGSWKDFIIKICESMCDLDEEKFFQFTEHPDFKGKEKRIISNSKNGLRVAVQVKPSIFVETNLSANDILNYSKLIIEKYEKDNVEVSYKLKK